MKAPALTLTNPFRPGAGHRPPYLAGREAEKLAFKKLLDQNVVLTNLVLTGLRGVGKTVLLEELKPLAIKERWLWVGTDLSESSSVSEETISCRLLADLSVVTNGVTLNRNLTPVGFSSAPETKANALDYNALLQLYTAAPGLVADKLKSVLETVWQYLSQLNVRGIVFAYDEAQTMSDHAETNQFPLSVLLDVFQSIQRKGVPLMLVMVGLPTLFPKLVEARTYAERMFSVQILGRLNAKECEDAILKAIKDANSAIEFKPHSVALITEQSGGYPYFVQFFCKELFDIFVQQFTLEGAVYPVPISGIVQKLDKDFFSGRWARATDRQRDLLSIIAKLPNCDDEFSVQEIVQESKKNQSPFSPSHVNQMLVTLSETGLIYKNRYGRYAFAVPLLGQFIRRQEKEMDGVQMNLPMTSPPSESEKLDA
jgi:hypothetical protein